MAKRSARKKKHKTVPAKVRWCSDVIVDLMHRYDFPYAALNPGASFRGLHDSMVNYGQDDPKMLLCPHENIAVQIAHGYAKATGEPMVAIVHDLVGMLHSCMAVYYAYIDRAPIFIIGATGPMDISQRRPRIDWIHTALVQGTALREYTKWDDQPMGIDSVADSFARAFSVMMTEPQGPIYMCYDAGLQETPLPHPVALPPVGAASHPTRLAPDAGPLAEAAAMLVRAKNPILLTDRSGRMPHGFTDLVKLAETVSAAVIDTGARLNFPNRHPLNMSLDAKAALRNADLVLCLDAPDWEKPSTELDATTREVKSMAPKACTWVEIGFGDLEISAWSTDYQRFLHADLSILADTAIAIPQLTKLCRQLLRRNAAASKRAAARAKRVTKMHAAAQTRWDKKAKVNWRAKPMSTARLATEIWAAIRDEDWVLTACTLNDWVYRIWDFDKPYRFPGESLGTSTQIGISLGVALAHKGKKRLIVDIQPDGDLMFDPGALWVAAKYKIPMLVVMYNNRSYYNDWAHQIRMANKRGTPVARAHIGMDITDPEVDFAGLARSMGWHAEGPIEEPEDIAGALRRAILEVKAGRPALVDAVTLVR